MTPFHRGEVWIAYVGAVTSRKRSGTRPVLIISADGVNQGPLNHLLVVPLNTGEPILGAHVPLAPPEGGVLKLSYIMCEHVRGLPKQHLMKCWGAVSAATMRSVERNLQILLQLPGATDLHD